MDGKHAERFGPYVLESVLGRGGMGVVYQARDTVKERTVALKLLASDLTGDPSFEARFRRESRVAAQLNDPHVIPIHDFGEIDGRLFIDMRLVEGENLSDRLASDGPMPVATAIAIVAQVASALDAAHRRGLVHRDVKPANILLSGLDRPDRPPFAYLVDFGIARVLPARGGTAPTTTATIGTVSYMAPERIMGQPGDHRVDVYSLGCVLFECVTGRVPFDGEPAAVIYAHLSSPPPDPISMVPGVSVSLRDVITKAMAKDPQQRFDSCGELADAAMAALRSAAAATMRVSGHGLHPDPTGNLHPSAPDHAHPAYRGTYEATNRGSMHPSTPLGSWGSAPGDGPSIRPVTSRGPMATTQVWAMLCIGVLAFIFSFVSYYRYTVPNDPSFSAEATAWHGFFGWFAVVLALSGSALAVRELFSTRATAEVGTARAVLVVYSAAVGCAVLSLLVVPADPGNTYGLSPDRGHGTGYWVSLILLLAGLALSLARYRRLAGTPPTTSHAVTG